MSTVPETQPVSATSHEAVINEKVAQLSIADENTPTGSSKASVNDSANETAGVAAPSVDPTPVIATESSVAAAPATATQAAVVLAAADESQFTVPPGTKGPFKLPIAAPVPTAKPEAKNELTADQQKKYDNVLTAVEAWTELSDTSAKNASKSPITDDEKLWLTRDCLLRYLRAAKWEYHNALQRLTSTLVWRREYGVSKLTAEHIGPENETGKQVLLGFDNSGRPCLYQDPSKQNTPESDRQVQHMVYLLEKGIELMPPGQETLALIINYKNTSRKTQPSMATSRKVLTILQEQYPERLGRALILELPWFISAFFKLITPFIDPVTRTKLVFDFKNQPLPNFIPPVQLRKDYGGEADFTYDHSEYWPALNKLCEERSKAYKARWEARGKKIGDDEFILRGGQYPTAGSSAQEAIPH